MLLLLLSYLCKYLECQRFFECDTVSSARSTKTLKNVGPIYVMKICVHQEKVSKIPAIKSKIQNPHQNYHKLEESSD